MTQTKIAKLEKLVNTATNARQKNMYKNLLAKALEQEKAAQLKLEKEELEKKLAPEQEQKLAQQQPEKLELESLQESPNKTTKQSPIYQAVGLIEGLVSAPNEHQLLITLDEHQYPINYLQGQRKEAFKLLLSKTQTDGDLMPKLMVYPNVYLQSNEVKLSFSLVSYLQKPTAQSNTLTPGEFKLSGFWHYIPQCDTPVISIYRNPGHGIEKRLKRLSARHPQRAKRIIKAQHLPVIWNNPSVKPFKYNPKLEKKPQLEYYYFVQVQAKFNPEAANFEVIEQTGEPLKKAEAPPRVTNIQNELKN